MHLAEKILLMQPLTFGGDYLGAIEILDDFLRNDRKAEGHQDLVGMRSLVEMLDQAALHREADKHHDRYGEQYRQRHRPVDNGLP